MRGTGLRQEWTPQPITGLDGRFTLRGDATVTIGTDDTGYFNYTDYDHTTLHLVRFDATAALRAGDHVTFLTELRAEGDSLHGEWLGAVYAAFVRYRPWTARPIDVSAGRVPTAFGAYTARSYATDNLLIGTPLAYQYLTAIRSDAIPANADQLAAMRGRGWLVEYPIGSQTLATGLPLVSLSGYDTGLLVQAGGVRDRVQGLASVTAGTLGSPGIDHNGSPQVAGRLVVRPAIGLVLGHRWRRATSSSNPSPICCRRRSSTVDFLNVPGVRTRSTRVSTGWSAPKSSRATGGCPRSISR